jgi:hypothetical protein
MPQTARRSRSTEVLKLCRLLSIAGMFLALPVFAALHAQPMARERVVRITALPERIGSPYPAEDDSRVGGWFYAGEPVTIALTLWNNTNEALVLRNTTGEWHAAARVIVRKASARAPGRTVDEGPEIPVRWRLVAAISANASAPPASLAPGQSQRVRLSLDGGAAALPPGVYELRVLANDATLPASLRNKQDLTREVRFLGIHAVETRADELNLAFHMATWALSGKDNKSAREWLQKMLQLNPTSRPAFNLLGDAAAATGDCAGAATQWKKAAEIVALDADPDAIPLSEWAKGDALRSLHRKIDTCR